MQEFFYFVVGDFRFGGESEHYLVSLLALAVLNCDTGSHENFASGVQNTGLYWGRRGRQLNRLRFWGYRLIWRYLSRLCLRLSRFGCLDCFYRCRSRFRRTCDWFGLRSLSRWARRFRDGLWRVWCGE